MALTRASNVRYALNPTMRVIWVITHSSAGRRVYPQTAPDSFSVASNFGAGGRGCCAVDCCRSQNVFTNFGGDLKESVLRVRDVRNS